MTCMVRWRYLEVTNGSSRWKQTYRRKHATPHLVSTDCLTRWEILLEHLLPSKRNWKKYLDTDYTKMIHKLDLEIIGNRNK